VSPEAPAAPPVSASKDLREFIADLACPTPDCGAFHHVHNPGGSVYLINPAVKINCKNCSAVYSEASILKASRPYKA
jgi:hypothetical protein